MFERLHTLKTKCIYFDPEDDDGIAISVMRSHTDNFGKLPHPRLSEFRFELWWPELAAPPRLLGDYYKRGLAWERFEGEYRRFLENPAQIQKIKILFDLLRKNNVTIKCIEETPEHCHRRLLAEECLKIQPNLKLVLG